MGCTHSGCGRKVLAKGLCSGHYSRQRKGQDMDAPIREKDVDRGCSVMGCDDKHRELGLCAFHAVRYRRGTPLDAPKQPQLSKTEHPVCSVEGCDKPNRAAGLCQQHYRRKVSGGSLSTPIRPMSQPVGTSKPGPDGYVTEKGPDNRWRGQHCLRMEELLGRPLVKGETVHHVNGDRADNTTNGPLVDFRSGNLELWSKAQPAGQRVADKIAFACEILARYT